MSEWVIITLVIAGIMLILGVIVILILQKKRKDVKKKEPDYRAFFCVGFVFMPAGIALMIGTKNPGLLGITALGAFYIILGLANKDKWKKNK